MKLSVWANQNGISYKTAWRMYKADRLPHPVKQLPTGTILIFPERTNKTEKQVVLYARVSSRSQQVDLDRQLQRLRDYAAAQGYQVLKEVSEIGSGLNGRRKKLLRLLQNPQVHTILVEHKDRLARFGFELLHTSLAATGREIQVLNKGECNDDLVQDMIDVLTSFCGRLYGKRSARNRAKKALETLQQC